MGFQCRYPGCERSYIRKEHLLRHEQDHANLRQFTCHQCPASFNRRDLLSRHVSMKHATVQPKPSGGSRRDPEIVDHVGTHLEEPMFPSEDGIWPPTPVTNPFLCNPSHCSMLEDVYFQNFHPHWPILHQQSYRKTPQPPDLIRSVLVAGLWMVGTHRGAEAMTHHDSLLKVLGRELSLPLEIFNKIPRELGARNLALFQALLIPLILCTYRGQESIAQSIVYTKHLFLAFEHAGMYDQVNIDAAGLDPIVREQYQRLVLVHFKTYIHVNVTFTEHFSKFKPFEYLHPKQLKVKVPSPLAVWDGPLRSSSELSDRRMLVGDLCWGGVGDSCHYSRLGPMIACDFTTGMILGCFITQQPDETYADLMRRIQPFLFLHKNHLVVDGGDLEVTG